MTRAASKFLLGILAMSSVALANAALAQTQAPASAPAAKSTSSIGAVLSELERKIIDEYYRLKHRMTGTEPTSQPGAEPPRRTGALTRSVHKDPEAGAPLPPGTRRDPLPDDLRAKLPPPSPGTDRLLVGNDVVLVDRQTSVVLDLMRGAAAKKP
jgi:Ni/Co efflux regulator RcnB